MLKKNRPKRLQDIVWRAVDGETAIISSDNKKMHILSDVGSRIWSLLDGEHDLANISTIIAGEYETAENVVEKDLVEYIDELKRLDLIVVK